ncbi:MAG: dihydrolipoamide acetyltransferase family protein [Thermoplasmata archaeon]
MEYEFRLPDIGEGVAEGEIVQWFVQEGGTVREDAPLVSVLTDKANVEIPSPKSGTVLRLHAQVGDKVKVGAPLVTIDVGSGAGAPSAVPPGTKSPAPAAPASLSAPPSPSTPTATPSSPARPAGAAAGTLTGRILASPYVRRLAAERGIDLAHVTGTGDGGRITEADLAKAAAGGPSAVAAAPPAPAGRPVPATPSAPAAAGPSSAPALPSGPDGITRIPIRGIRRVIAEHMTESKHKAAHFTYVEEVDMTEMVRLRERMAPHIERQGARLSYLPFILKAVVAGLRAQPNLNATIDDARGELLVHSAHHIGIATAAPEGLLVPVVKDVDAKSILDLAREIQSLAERGREGKLTRAELTGSTFTITSLGALGGVLATPILNYPEVGILGVHKIQRRPVYRPDGAIGPADLMNLSVSVDHRVLDGIVAAQFLAVVKANLEDPHRLFAEMA